MKRDTTPTQILRNLRNLIDEAEAVLACGRGQVAEARLSELKDRVQAGFSRLREYSGDVGGRFKDYYGDTEDRLRCYYEEIEERLRSGAGKTADTVRTHPYRAAMFSLGVVLIASSLISSSRKCR